MTSEVPENETGSEKQTKRIQQGMGNDVLEDNPTVQEENGEEMSDHVRQEAADHSALSSSTQEELN